MSPPVSAASAFSPTLTETCGAAARAMCREGKLSYAIRLLVSVVPLVVSALAGRPGTHPADPILLPPLRAPRVPKRKTCLLCTIVETTQGQSRFAPYP